MNKLDNFKALIADADTTENDIQNFIEENPNFLIQDYMRNHFLKHNCFITKFDLDGLTTDFLYMSNSSSTWNIILVELERHDISFFKKSKTILETTAEFNKGLAQIDTWKEWINQNKEYIVTRLEPFMRPLQSNPVHYKYVLIAGRDSEIKNNQKAIRRFHNLETRDITIHTYDSLFRWYKAHKECPPPNIIVSTPS